jgi:hypothetical protein
LKPPDATQDEPVLSGWKEIATAMGTSIKTVQRLADEDFDALPIWDYRGTPIAYPSALRDWRGRQKVAWNKARKLARQALGVPSSPSEERKAG